jgi:non-canonical (house-cleaning) NTP pyrophosphatase
MYHIEGMKQAAMRLEELGHETEIPNPREGRVEYAKLPFVERTALKHQLIQEHLNKIRTSDAILVYNDDKNGVEGYIGGNTLMEMAFAYTQALEIFTLKDAPELSYKDEIEGMQPIVISGDVEKINEYFESLPKTVVSTSSEIKLRAVSRGMRRAGIRTNVLPHPTNSGVNEQPRNAEETYEGAHNRQNTLRKEVQDTAYLVTVESGLFNALPGHNVFASTVVVIEASGQAPKTGINVELEYPKEMTDKIPSVYPDLGVLAKEEYGAVHKDPFPYFTNHKIDRLQLVETAVFNVAAQLEQS